jgi:hypothetical protein
LGAWNIIRWILSSPRALQSAFVDGTRIGTGRLPTASTDVELILIGINSAGGSTAQSFADTLSVTSSVPEHSTWQCCSRASRRSASWGFAGRGREALRRSPPVFIRKRRMAAMQSAYRCANCMSPTFDEIDKSDSFTLYADTLDDPSAFHPTSSQKAVRSRASRCSTEAG